MTFDQLAAKPTPSDVRMFYESGATISAPRYFFERKTMRFFGDTMRSFGARTIGGNVYLFRKPSASVNVFGRHHTAGRQFFNAWRLDPVTYDLRHCSAEETQRVFDAVASRY
jgi:hypothetical protein